MRRIVSLLPTFVLAAVQAFAAGESNVVKTLNTPRTFPEITSQAQWLERKRAIREQILVDAGLWPMPERTPLRAAISGKIVRDGYSVEKVLFQSYPGFYVGGNLYRPVGKGAGPFPGILDVHGHWVHGRLEDTDNCSAPGRCINFAKQGMVAFAYDMVGYNDTQFADEPSNLLEKEARPNHTFGASDPANLLWNVNLMGLQTWDSIRALDFLETLPDVDQSRLAITGASGGGTQTFILGAVDDRLAAQAPVNMVSHTMQGGCQCENMPGLRVEYNNMEIAACAAPRPQLMVSATGDWTKTTLTTEGPAVEHIYGLFQQTEKLRYVQYDFPHNYNQTSRQAVYQWFDKCLLNAPDQPVAEVAFKKEPNQDLLNFPDGKLPADAVTQQGLIDYLKKMRGEELERITPRDENSTAKYKEIMGPAWAHTLQLKWPPELITTSTKNRSTNAAAYYVAEDLEVRRPNENDAIHLVHFVPTKAIAMRLHPVVILVDPDGKAPFVDDDRTPKPGLARHLLDSGFEVVVMSDAGRPANSKQASLFYATYNRTRLQERVRDLVSVCQGIKASNPSNCRVVLWGTGNAALWAMLAAPAADAVVAEGGPSEVMDDKTFLGPDLFCPGIRVIDTFEGALCLASPHPLFLDFNGAASFPLAHVRSTYGALNALNKNTLDVNPPGNAVGIIATLSEIYGAH